MKEEQREALRKRMLLNNPAKRKDIRERWSRERKGRKAWNKGITGEEYIRHFKDGVKGGRKKGYRHTEESKLKVSVVRKKRFQEGTLKIVVTEKGRRINSEKLKKQRKDPIFNAAMCKAMSRAITKPHMKVKEMILSKTSLKTQSNYPYEFGYSWGSIDEADIEKKVAIFVDGNYWHKYPNGRRWDKFCKTYLENKGWKVLRIWESEIKENPESILE